MSKTRKTNRREFWEFTGAMATFFLMAYLFVWTPLSRSMGW